jgi:D-beta-D-heptose 7-phosphate kinase/D-beta-D-heptose 1-phosphate adenosyltransferase
MQLPPIDSRRASDLISRFRELRVLVVGDVMLDRFIVGVVTRISPEAPVPVVRFQSEHVRLGGAANVAHNIAALGGTPTLVGLIGSDGSGEQLRRELTAAGIGSEGLVEDRERPTTEKVRVVTERNQQVARIDYEADADVTGPLAQALIDRVSTLAVHADAFLVSDYLKGTITRPLMDVLIARSRSASRSDAQSRAPLIVDPKIPHLDCYAGAAVVTPNHHESETATHRRIRTDDDARLAGRELRARVGCDAVLMTLGEQGMWLSASDVEGSIPAVAREVADVTGAGDTVVATLALALAAGAPLEEAAVLANHAAGIVVGKFGAATVTRDELITNLQLSSLNKSEL